MWPYCSIFITVLALYSVESLFGKFIFKLIINQINKHISIKLLITNIFSLLSKLRVFFNNQAKRL